MKFKELTYTRKNNLGNYTTEDIGITVTLEEGDKPSVIFPKLKEFVVGRLEKSDAAPKAPSIPASVIPAKPLSAPVQDLNNKIAEAAKAAGVTTQW